MLYALESAGFLHRANRDLREHLISSQFFSKRNAFQIGFTPLPPPSIRKAYRTFSDNNRCRLSSRPRLSTTKLLPAGLLSFSSREASADNIISTSSSFSHKFPVSLHASSALRLASFEADRDCRQRKHLQTSHNGWMENGMDPLFWQQVFQKGSAVAARHRGPHRTKKKFSHAICLCLVRVHKVHVLYIARVQSCSRALWRSGLG